MLAADGTRGADNPSPTQVWGALAIEQQERVIHLLAHLAWRWRPSRTPLRPTVKCQGQQLERGNRNEPGTLDSNE
jgi:hypothetical protein